MYVPVVLFTDSEVCKHIEMLVNSEGIYRLVKLASGTYRKSSNYGAKKKKNSRHDV